MNPAPETPAPRSQFWVTALAALGCFVVFLVVLYLAYLPQRRAAPTVDLSDHSAIPKEEQWKYTPEGRAAHLTELRAHEQAVATSYAWIDKGHGVVQLPLDRAMELTLRDLQPPSKP